MKHVIKDLMLVHERHALHGKELCHKHCITQDQDDFVAAVQDEFISGVHREYKDAIIRALMEKGHAQQDMAEILGLKDRSSISKMIKSATMGGVRMTAALYYNGNISLPSQERATLAGIAQATTFVKGIAQGKRGVQDQLCAQDAAFLIGVLACDEWDHAIASSDPRIARKLAARIVDQNRFDPRVSCRPEQLVLLLQEIRVRWGDYAIVVLWAIPTCIPTPNL